MDQIEEEDGFDDPDDNEVENGGFDELEDELETMQQMETDKNHQTVKKTTAVGDITVSHAACADAPGSWEELDLEDDILRMFPCENKSCGYHKLKMTRNVLQKATVCYRPCWIMADWMKKFGNMNL
jgi:hypothetical protein